MLQGDEKLLVLDVVDCGGECCSRYTQILWGHVGAVIGLTSPPLISSDLTTGGMHDLPLLHDIKRLLKTQHSCVRSKEWKWRIAGELVETSMLAAAVPKFGMSVAWTLRCGGTVDRKNQRTSEDKKLHGMVADLSQKSGEVRGLTVGQRKGRVADSFVHQPLFVLEGIELRAGGEVTRERERNRNETYPEDSGR